MSFNPKFLQLNRKSSLVLCEFSKSQAYEKETSFSDTHFSNDASIEPEGTGAAAPTPGERFLERQQSIEAAKLVLKENKKLKKNKKEKRLKVPLSVACCYGCGSPLQTFEVDAPGYVDSETFELV